ncbi:MAG: DUF362 domain-containing protein [Candidatus Bathyarchaeota archaeon]|nr:MAG: DUF362 domain-containing protein [Candidatus Bathyarchaeota archaeon]
MKGVVSVVACNSLEYEDVETAIRKSLNLVGGIKTFVEPGSAVLVKPNVGVASPPEEGRTTDPNVVRAVIRQLKAAGVERVIIGEASVVGVDTFKALKVSGILEVAEEEKAEVLDFKREQFSEVSVPAGLLMKKIRFARAALEADAIVNVPKLKTICTTLVSVGLKNLKGLLPDSEKRRFHLEGVNEAIVDLNSVVRPAVTIVDGIIANELYRPRKLGVIITGKDPLAVDTVATRVLNIKNTDVIHLRLAASKKLGISDLNKIHILGARIEEVAASFKTAPQGLSDLAFENVEIFDGSPCSGCVGVLTTALKQAKDRGFLKKHGKRSIFIGSKTPTLTKKNSIAFGNCAHNCRSDLFIKGCPPILLDVVKALEDSIYTNKQG